jgi:hypothetical protein
VKLIARDQLDALGAELEVRGRSGRALAVLER